MQSSNTLLNILRVACVLTLIIIVLGAYVRLSHAGLGCPDWPGCYGRLLVPEEAVHIEEANQAYPARPLEQDKAWKEMIHRYVAGILGIFILTICILCWVKIRPLRTRLLATSILVLVILQALLGMWTVTLLLKPLVVLLHLLGGMTILSLLYWLMLREQVTTMILSRYSDPRLYTWAVTGLIILFMQISLGGWTSANYAALACADFPACQGVFWPNMNFREGFVLWRGLGIDYEGGVLDGPTRTAIHFMHRIGAIITFVAILIIASRTISTATGCSIRLTGITMLILLFVQVSLGIVSVMQNLPLSVAVAHNGVAALLLLSLVTLLHQSIPVKMN